MPSVNTNQKAAMPVQKARKRFLWFGGIIFVVFLLVRNLGLPDFEFQFHDTYIRFDANTTTFCLTIMILAAVSMFLIVEVTADLYRIVGLLIAIVNPILGIFVIVAINTLWAVTDTAGGMNASTGFPWHVVVLAILFSVLCLQAVVEVRVLKKFFGLIRNGN